MTPYPKPIVTYLSPTPNSIIQIFTINPGGTKHQKPYDVTSHVHHLQSCVRTGQGKAKEKATWNLKGFFNTAPVNR